MGDFCLAWLWAEGWRARLRKCGDIVEQARWEWRMDDMIGHPNNVPVIVATVPGVFVPKRQNSSMAGPGRNRYAGNSILVSLDVPIMGFTCREHTRD
ncbi:hypothetical protein GE09DRAFT_260564 [Coniochaeta sp. 2T2.1]|nr:hypothetical protein GE09DRAFT_260564 [Coniochaeta sp. 2T2.1]